LAIGAQALVAERIGQRKYCCLPYHFSASKLIFLPFHIEHLYAINAINANIAVIFKTMTFFNQA